MKSEKAAPQAAKKAHKSAPSRVGNGQARGHDNGQKNTQNVAQNSGQNNAQGKASPAVVRGSAGDPPGNNGTVKIAALGDLDRIPNNTPHPGCAFEVQWYGFDGGSDVVSTVSFTPQAPTSDVAITVNGPTSVPVGEDAASGAGTATGLDAVQDYTLSFSGGAPVKQGYHVRLTVSTPRSLGNDTKTKVFWVEPCEGSSLAAPTAPAAGQVALGAPQAAHAAAPLAHGKPAAVAGQAQHLGLGALAASPAAIVAPPAPDRVGTPSSTGVPTAIDAGERHNALARAVGSPWGIGLVAVGGVLVALGAVVARRRV